MRPNPNDATFRNITALKKRVLVLLHEIQALEKRVAVLERKKRSATS